MVAAGCPFTSFTWPGQHQTFFVTDKLSCLGKQLYSVNDNRIWVNNPDENLGMVVKVVSLTAEQEEIEIGSMDGAQAPYMQLDISRAAWRARTKRTAHRTCSEEHDPGTTECCMWPLTIDFEEFGWDWVLFPR